MLNNKNVFLIDAAKVVNKTFVLFLFGASSLLFGSSYSNSTIFYISDGTCVYGLNNINTLNTTNKISITKGTITTNVDKIYGEVIYIPNGKTIQQKKSNNSKTKKIETSYSNKCKSYFHISPYNIPFAPYNFLKNLGSIIINITSQEKNVKGKYTLKNITRTKHIEISFIFLQNKEKSNNYLLHKHISNYVTKLVTRPPPYL